MANYLKLQWTNSCDLGKVYYQASYANILYLDTLIGEPEYVNVEEGEENGDGVFIKTSEKLEKIYKFSVTVPEYVADALTFMALHDNILAIYTNGLFFQQIRNVKVNVSWEEITEGCMATVEVKFQINDQILKDTCCTNMVVS